ncbi:conserved hypothetical protein [Candidatus Sulfotelmatobacter sp. SbA7]|jgi:uncharacterized protein (TIGR04255 family)|nr:conserved hypothetical protein [Candidatus Sulfotelmatobacter sp. SbA7]
MLEKEVAAERTLPDFENPPAVETLMGVHFTPIKRWQGPYFGLFWSRIKKEYPRVEIQPPVVTASTPEMAVAQFQSRFELPMRCWFFNQGETRLIQVQSNLFLHNWRKVRSTDKYLHYDDLRPLFEREWQGFRSFLEDEGLGSPVVQFCEVTYVNHIDRGSGWDTFAELSELFPNWSSKTSENYLPSPELVAMNASYALKGVEGRLQISVQPAVRQTDAKETIQLTVTARCKPASSSKEDICRGLDEARKWVVLGFTDFTSPKMHALWGRKI